jgi:phosphate transport system permease protein
MADRVRLVAKGAALLTLALLLPSVPRDWRLACHQRVRPRLDQYPPGQNEYGLVMIYGTIATSLIALLIAVPVRFGIALFLTGAVARMAEAPLGTAIELLAAVPSIVYGACCWSFGPTLATHAAAAAKPVDRRHNNLCALVSGPAGGYWYFVGTLFS